MPSDGRDLAEGPELLYHRTSSEHAIVLRSLPAFSGIDDEGVAMIAEHAVDRAFRPGDMLFEEGAPTDSVHIVLNGRVTISRHGKVTAEIGRHGGVGFVTLLGEDPHGITAVADEPTETIQFSAEVLREAYEESFPLLRNNLRLAAAFILKKRGDLPRPKDSDSDVDLGTWRDRQLTLVERVINLRRGIFSETNMDAAIGVARAGREVRYEPGDVIWHVGDPTAFSCFVSYGRIRCENAAGDSVMVGCDFALGSMDLFGGQEHSFSAVAETKVIAVKLDREAFLAVLESHYDLAMGFCRILSNVLLATQS